MRTVGKMNVLVLGGTKYAGVHLVNELIANGHEITIATRGKTKDHFGNQVKRKKVERQSLDSLREAFTGERYDVVIDNLAFSSHDVRVLLDTVQTQRYVLTSTASVYKDFHMNMQEKELDTKSIPLKWCGRDDAAYDEGKRQAEAALFQAYPNIPSVAVRFPWIFGSDDDTKRLYFYVEHIMNGQAMKIDNPDARLSFINSNEAGRFLAWCAENPVSGCLNASSSGTVSLAEIVDDTEKRSGKKAVISKDGEPAPLNGVPSFRLDTGIAQNAGYRFQAIADWVYPTIDGWVTALLHSAQ